MKKLFRTAMLLTLLMAPLLATPLYAESSWQELITTNADCNSPDLEAATTYGVAVAKKFVEQDHYAFGYTTGNMGRSATSGDEAFYIQNKNSAANNARVSFVVRLPKGKYFETGKTYLISFDLKADDEIKLYRQARTANNNAIESEVLKSGGMNIKLNATSEWQNFTEEFTVCDNLSILGEELGSHGGINTLSFGFGKSITTLYIDNISLKIKE